MIKKTILGEKVMSAIKGGDFCCWGGPGDGCDCTSSNGELFVGSFEIWLKRLTRLQAQPIV